MVTISRKLSFSSGYIYKADFNDLMAVAKEISKSLFRKIPFLKYLFFFH